MQNLWFTTSKIINHVKARLGAAVRTLELDNDAIAQVLKDETLEALSVYFPKTIGYIVDTKEDIVDNQRGLFYINTPTQLLGAELILSMSTLGQSGAYDFYDRSFQICPHEFVLAWLQAEVSGFTTIPYSAELVPPNKIRITPIPPSTNENKIALKLKVAHTDFTEFHPGLREVIYDLGACDVKLDILGFRSVFTNINASMADLELSMGTFEEAKSERKELLEKIRSFQHLSVNRRKIWCQ
jgi:hypothetical protein